MAKSELKTKMTEASVEEFFDALPDAAVQADCRRLAALMAEATGAPPKMWGANIVGFGERRLKYESGREIDWLEIAFAPRKGYLTLSLTDGEPLDAALLEKLGKHKLGKNCLYVKRLADVDPEVLKRLVEDSVAQIRKK